MQVDTKYTDCWTKEGFTLHDPEVTLHDPPPSILVALRAAWTPFWLIEAGFGRRADGPINRFSNGFGDFSRGGVGSWDPMTLPTCLKTL